MKKITFLSTLLCFTAITSVNAAQLDVTGNTTLAGDQSYDNNTGSGIYTTGTGGMVTSNNRITANNNIGNGVSSNTGVNLGFQGNSGNSLVARDNTGSGIAASGSGSEITINQMNIDTSFNQGDGMSASANSNISVNGDTSGVNTVYTNDNAGAGIHSDSSTINLNYVDIHARRNVEGLLATNNGVINILGVVSGSNSVVTNANTIGIQADGAQININRMDITSSDNNTYGIDADNGSTITISGSGGRINRILAENNGNAALHAGVNSVISVVNKDIFTSRNGAGLLAENAGIIIVETQAGFPATLLDMRGNTTSSLGATGAGSLVSVTGADIIFDRYVERNPAGAITFEAVQQFGAQAQNGGTVSVVGYPERNEMALNHSTVAGIGVSDANSSVNISNMNMYATRNTFAQVVRDGVLNVDNSDIIITDDSSGIIVNDGVGTINFDTVNFETTTTLLEARNLGNAILNAIDSNMQGQVITAASAVSTLNLDNSIWQILNSSNVTNLNMDPSTVDLRSQTAGTYNTLTVGNLTATGDGNVIQMNTYLGSDGSPSDLLVITNSSSGNFLLDITNTGGPGGVTGTGIQVVDNQTGSIGAIFGLKYGILESGAYQYDLFQEDGDGGGDLYSWYLRNVGFGNTMNCLINVPDVSMSVARAGMSSLNSRLGELRADDCRSSQGLWIRNHNKFMTVEHNTKSKMQVIGVEVGYDHRIDMDAPNRVYVGVMAGYTAVDSIVTDNTALGKDGEGNGYAPSVGVYATWLGTNGYYVDAAVRTFWSNLDMKTYTTSGQAVKFSTNNQVTSVSLETGRKIRYFVDRYSSVVFEPKLGLLFTYGTGDDLNVNGSLFKYDATTSFITRLAMLVGYQTPIGRDTVLEPYIELGLFREWAGETKITYAGTSYIADSSGLGYDVSLGVNAYIGRHTSIFGAIGYEQGKKYDSFNTNLGMRYSW